MHAKIGKPNDPISCIIALISIVDTPFCFYYNIENAVVSMITQPRRKPMTTKYNQPIIILYDNSIVVNNLFNVGVLIQFDELFILV